MSEACWNSIQHLASSCASIKATLSSITAAPNYSTGLIPTRSVRCTIISRPLVSVSDSESLLRDRRNQDVVDSPVLIGAVGAPGPALESQGHGFVRGSERQHRVSRTVA